MHSPRSTAVPDNRHLISLHRSVFDNFKLRIARKLSESDMCSLAALKYPRKPGDAISPYPAFPALLPFSLQYEM
jgi:hypothetical protein